MDLAKIIGEKKFMWDGKIYKSEKDAEEAKVQYETDGFEIQVFTKNDKYYVYSRRVITDVVVDDQAP